MLRATRRHDTLPLLDPKECAPDIGCFALLDAMIEGFQNKGDDLHPGVFARWTVAEPAAAEPEPQSAK